MLAVASIVCTALSTRWPVCAARSVIVAVSESRLSPTKMTSGSWRRTERSVSAKPSPAFSFTSTCEIPARRCSIGFSMVTMLRRESAMSWSSPCAVVLLPLPVGPLMRIMPSGRRISRRSISRSAAVSPIFSSS
jgi:hypothetical protein